jgi:HPt (histidine-containing phosphotransfer) domain-containing protein
MTPLQIAADDAEQVAAGLRAAAQEAMTLEDEADVLWNAATDAIEAYHRAKDRAREARKLADHSAGSFNAWQETR